MMVTCQEILISHHLSSLTIAAYPVTIIRGSGCVPVDAFVFKMSGRLRKVGGGGFDSHPLPPISQHMARFSTRLLHPSKL